MIFLYILILLLALYGIKINKAGCFADYIEKEQCNAIKGIFIIVVFCRHIWPYMMKAGYTFSNIGDVLFLYVDGIIQQLLVVMFLFYSGYGVMQSIEKKGNVYVKSIPRKRFLATLLNFDVAVLVFLLLDILICRELEPPTIVLAFTGWTSLGNSNWYIFVMLVCYIATYIGFVRNKGICGWIYMLGLIFIFFIILRLTKDCYWWNTLFVYPFGMLYSQYKKKIEGLVTKNWGICFTLCILVFVMLYNLPWGMRGLKHNIVSIVFAIMLIIMTMKVKIGNQILHWLGTNLFPLYIYQRIPMMALSVPNINLSKEQPTAYVIICMLMTLLIAGFYKYWRIKL